MFARTLKVEVIVGGERRPCPLEWLDSFCMRRFTGTAAFDDTFPRSDGVLEAGFGVDPERLAAGLSEWLTKKNSRGKRIKVQISEPGSRTA
ncbi:MAG: hypothetical protein ACE5HL_06200 [Terriglobia bacterium]